MPWPGGRQGSAEGVRAVQAAPLLAALLTLGAFALRASQLHQSLFGDEVLAYREVAGQTLGHTLRTVGTGVESSPPLFFVLAWLSAKLGDPTVWIRLPSLLLGSATIPVVYLLGRETIGRTGALIAAAIIAASPFATYYGIEARPYATMTFFVALSTLALLRAIRTGSRGYWALYAAASAAAAYSHYTAIFALVTQAGWSIWVCRRRWRPVLTANAVAIVLYLPWLPSLHGSALGVYALLERLTTSHVIRDVLHPVVGYPYASLRAIPTLVGLIVVTLSALLGLVWLYLSWRGRTAAAVREDTFPRILLIVLLALATPVGLLLYSLLGTDIWSSRSLIASTPAQALVLGGLLGAIPRPGRAVAVAVTLGFLVFATARSITPRYARPPYRTVAQYLDRVATPTDPLLMYSAALVLDDAIPAQLKRPHTVIDGIPKHWPQRPAGTQAFVVLDDAVGHALKLSTPEPSGFELVARHHYGGLVPFGLLTYRAR